MPRLKNRQKQIPNGLKFYDPALKWTAPANASFSVICDSLRGIRLANPGITAAKHLSTDPNAIADEVDTFNAVLCLQYGWTDFVSADGGGAIPFQSAPETSSQPHHQPPRLNPLQRLKSVAAGSEALVEWINSGAEAVPQKLSAARAAVCAKCPLNGRGGWEKWFTVPVSNAIRAALRHKGEFQLSTPSDDQLGVCEACLCPMPLKVHVPFDKFWPHMSPESKDALHPECWIRSESIHQ